MSDKCVVSTGRCITIQELKDSARRSVVSYLGREPVDEEEYKATCELLLKNRKSTSSMLRISLSFDGRVHTVLDEMATLLLDGRARFTGSVSKTDSHIAVAEFLENHGWEDLKHGQEWVVLIFGTENHIEHVCLYTKSGEPLCDPGLGRLKHSKGTPSKVEYVMPNGQVIPVYWAKSLASFARLIRR